MAETTICTEKDLAKLKFLFRSHLEKSKFLQDFSQILKERITIQEAYIKDITKFATQIDNLTCQGVLNNILITVKAAYQQKLHIEQSLLDVLKKEIVDAMEEITKKQNAEFNALMVEKKHLEKEHKHHLEKTEISQKSHLLHGRERDTVGLEIECLTLRRKQADPRQQKASEKHNNMTKMWMQSGTEYKMNVGEYNFFLEKLGAGIDKMNGKLKQQETEKVNLIKETARKLLNHETGLSVPSPEIDKLKGILEGINPKQELQDVLKQIEMSQNSSLKLDGNPHESFLQKELKEFSIPVNEKEEESLKAFRKYYEEILKKDVSAESSHFVVPASAGETEEEKQKTKGLEENMNFLAKLVDKAWRGHAVDIADLKKFHLMLKDKFLRKVFTAAVQQYRLSGKFDLTEDGFKHTIKILVHFLYACFKIKDATSIMKIMILSLTFWKFDPDKNQEKTFLHSKIVWHPIWRDLDFWCTSVYLSIREELKSQKSLEQSESVAETTEREKNVVFGQLLSFSHNMVTFMVDKNEMKKILEKFCYFYDLESDKVKQLLKNVDEMIRQHEQTLLLDKMKKEQEGPKPIIKISLISNYFGAKKSPVSSENGDSKSTSDDRQVGCEANKMIEEFRIEFEDDNLFNDVYGTMRGFSYSGEAGSSMEKFLKSGFSYGSENGKLDISQESDSKKSQIWF